MIQRIQSIYLFLVGVLCIVALCLPVGHFSLHGVRLVDFYNLRLVMVEGAYSYMCWPMAVVLLLVAVSAFLAIFLFKKRMLQVRLTVFSGILLVCYYILMVGYTFYIKGELEAQFSISTWLCLPLVSLVLDYLAFRAIMKDELLIRSLDRLR